MVKKKPIPLVPPPVKSRKRARQIVTSFHKLTKEAERIASGAATGEDEKNRRLKRLQRELQAMGGRQAYQSASLLSVSFHNTSKWVTQMLTKMNLRPQRGQSPLKVLEVGAINTRLLDIPWLDVRAIDLKSQHERIEERDFFSLQPAGDFDVLSSSMVINCVPTARRRGEMLMGYREHLRPGGHLFLMLPLLCLTNSKHTTRASFVATLEKAGFSLRESRDSPKVAFYCAVAVDNPVGHGAGPYVAPRATDDSGSATPAHGKKRKYTQQRMAEATDAIHADPIAGGGSRSEGRKGRRGRNDFAIEI